MGGSTEIVQASAPSQPSTADAVREWVGSMPQVYETQMKYAPLEAAQQVSMAQQYAQPLGEAYKAAQEAMYPGTVGLQEKLAGVATEGMESGLPDWAKESYLDTMRAQLGENALSGSGADYMSRGLLQQEQDWKNYYNNLGLSVTGRQPLTQASSPASTNYMSNYTPSSVMGYTAQNYGTAGNIYGNQLSYNSQANASQNNMFGSLMGTAGGMGSAALMAGLI